MIYRVTFGFAGGAVGWSETHAMLNQSNNPRDLTPTLTDIAAKRAQMLGREFAIIAIRIARYSTDGGTRMRGVHLVKKTFRNSVTTQVAAAEPANVALLVRGSAEPSVLNPQFDANENQTFLGAPLDISVDNGGNVDQGKGGLGAAFAAWRTAMLNTTIGWLGNQIIADVGVAAFAQNVNGTVTITTAVAVTPTLTVGQWYKARIRAVNQGVSPLNGELIVQCTAATTLVTREVIGIPTPQTGGFIKLYKQVQPFIDYGDLQLADTTAQHKRGRPFGSPPGRARRRIRG